MKLLYLHGLGSGPNGFKPTWLREQGFDVVAPAFGDDDVARSIELARQAFASDSFDVVVGSSRGGAVALALDTGQTPRVVIAPAWRRLRVVPLAGPTTVILHSAHDELVPIADSRELAVNWKLPRGGLIEIGDRHTMTDEAALSALAAAIRSVAKRSE